MCIGEKARAIEKEIKGILNDANRHFRIEVDEVEVCVDSWASYGKEQFANIKANIVIQIEKYDKNVNILWVIEGVLDDIEKRWDIEFVYRYVRV